MVIENELGGTQAAPEGTTAEIPGNETAPELNNDDELNNDNGEGNEGEGGEEQPESKAKADTEEQPDKNKQKPFYEKRFGELTRKAREAERRAEDLQARLDAIERGETKTTQTEEETPPKPRQQPAQQQPETDVEKAAERLVAQREFTAKVNSVIAAGEAEYDRDSFTQKCNLIADIGGEAVPEFMKIVTDADVVTDGHKVIAALADDPEEAERILSLNPVKMALAITKLSEKLSKPVTKKVSQVPAPVEPVNGAARPGSRLDDPNTPMDDFAPQFLKNLAARRR
jgi:hypothetical protein